MDQGGWIHVDLVNNHQTLSFECNKAVCQFVCKYV
jgi:hypothetical protein